GKRRIACDRRSCCDDGYGLAIRPQQRQFGLSWAVELAQGRRQLCPAGPIGAKLGRIGAIEELLASTPQHLTQARIGVNEPAAALDQSRPAMKRVQDDGDAAQDFGGDGVHFGDDTKKSRPPATLRKTGLGSRAILQRTRPDFCYTIVLPREKTSLSVSRI